MQRSEIVPKLETPDLLARPILDHIAELRRRLLWSALAIGLAFLLCYNFAPQIFQFLAHPLLRVSNHTGGLISTSPQEIFLTYLKIAFWGSIYLASPFLICQIWLFVAPGLYKHERRTLLPYLLATPLLFFVGSALVYTVIMPMMLQFLFSFEVPAGPGVVAITTAPRVAEYLSMIMSLTLAFGLSFQLPILLTLLARFGWLTSATLVAQRRLVIVGLFIVAAILTPPDVVSQITLAVPLLLLYEASILLVRWEERKQII